MQCVTNRRLVTRFVNSCIQLISTDRLTHCGAHTPRLLRSDLLRKLELVLRHGFLLDRLSAVIPSKLSYPAMPLAGQLVHQRFTIPGPLVQRNDSLNSYSYFLFHQRFDNQFVSQNAIVDFQIGLPKQQCFTNRCFLTKRFKSTHCLQCQDLPLLFEKQTRQLCVWLRLDDVGSHTQGR